MNNKRLAIVIPVYNEQNSLRILYTEIVKNLSNLGDLISSYRIVFVDDGSSDASLQVIRELAGEDSNVHAIVLRKNFGKAAALQAAFREVDEDIIITMDADLQDDPRELRNFIEKLNEGYDMVSGWKYNRLDPLEKTLPSKLFNKVTCEFSGVHLNDFNCGFKAYRKEVVKAIDVYGEYHRYIPVLAHSKGFKIAEIKVRHNKRRFGKSKYGFERYFRGLFDAMSCSFLLKYQDRPIYFFGRNGLRMCILAGLLMMIQIIQGVFGIATHLQNTFLFISLWALGLGFISFLFGFLSNLVVHYNFRDNYSDSHIREKF